VKILDRYLLTTFLKTFTTVFVILFFIFILQAVWLFIAELAGKDLDFMTILKFIIYYMPSMVPLVLPLSILLASIMTFGDLSENYEFAAMKSSGVSLKRAMTGLTIFMFFLSIVAFLFANNVIPYSQYKFTNIRRNLAQVKPAMAIAEGQFSEVGNFNIKVDKKSGENGNLLTGVTIHKKGLDGNGNTTVIKSKTGELRSSTDSNLLQLVLYDGSQYEEIITKKYEERLRMPFTKTFFKKYIFNIDLSSLNKIDENTNQITNSNSMLKISELDYTLDSLNKSYKKDIISFAENIHLRTSLTNTYTPTGGNVKPPENKIINTSKDLLSDYTNQEKTTILEVAKGNVLSTNFTITASKDEMGYKQKNINAHWVAIYDKFVIAYACLMMFFIGAPLGAIIRKGGLGLPIVFAVLIFISFHFINTFGRKLAEENGIMPFFGSWMSSIVLTPLAVLLTYRATNDIGLINFDRIVMPIQIFFQKIFSKKKIIPFMRSKQSKTQS
jgi:lipopolysaccharide export system permease protein